MKNTASSLLNEIEYISIRLTTAVEALDLFHDGLCSEAFQCPEKVDETKAVTFARRSSMHMSTLSIIIENFCKISEELDKLVENKYGV